MLTFGESGSGGLVEVLLESKYKGVLISCCFKNGFHAVTKSLGKKEEKTFKKKAKG